MSRQETDIASEKKAQKMNNPMCKRLHTIKEAAAYLGLPVWSIRTLIWNAKLPFIKNGHTQYVDVKDLDAYIEREKKLFV